MKRGRDPRQGTLRGTRAGSRPGLLLRGESGKTILHGVARGVPIPRGGPDQDKSMKGLILAQSERWRRGLGMQVERETGGNSGSKAAKG